MTAEYNALKRRYEEDVGDLQSRLEAQSERIDELKARFDSWAAGVTRTLEQIVADVKSTEAGEFCQTEVGQWLYPLLESERDHLIVGFRIFQYIQSEISPVDRSWMRTEKGQLITKILEEQKPRFAAGTIKSVIKRCVLHPPVVELYEQVVNTRLALCQRYGNRRYHIFGNRDITRLVPSDATHDQYCRVLRRIMSTWQSRYDHGNPETLTASEVKAIRNQIMTPTQVLIRQPLSGTS